MSVNLAIDTCFKNWSITISNEEEIITKEFISKNDISSIFVNSVDEILKQMNIEIRDVDLFSITNGPGLFTGIRIGLSAIKGLNFALRKPVVSLTTLEVIGYQANKSGQHVLSLVNARRNEVYASIFDYSKNITKTILEPILLNINDLKEYLSRFEPFVIVSYDLEDYTELLENQYSNLKLIPSDRFLSENLLNLSFLYYRNGLFIKDLDEMNPFYIRKPDAEVKNKRTNK